MINVSQDYLDNIYDDETKTYCTASFGAYDLNGKSQATITATDEYYEAGRFIDFTSSLAPTEWNAVNPPLSYKSINYFGEWNISANYADSNAYPLSNAFDGNETQYQGTYYRVTVSSSKTGRYVLLESPLIIIPRTIKIRHARGSGSYPRNCEVKLSAYNADTNSWDYLGDFETSLSWKIVTLNYSGDNKYTKFRLDLSSNLNENVQYFLYNFVIETGKVLRSSPYDTVDGVIGVPGDAWVNKEESDANGNFSTTPTITYTWNENHSSPGLQLYFGGIVKSAIITYYDSSNQVLDTYNLSGNTDTYTIENPVTNYRKIQIEFIQIEHNSRVIFEEINFGLEYIFREEIVSVEIEEVLDYKMQELPSSKATLKMNNINGTFDIHNPTGLIQFLQKGQRIQIKNTALFNGVTETVDLGTFYLSSWKNESQYTTSLEFNDIMLRLANRIFYKSKFYDHRTETVYAYDYLEDMFNSFNMNYDGTVQYELDNQLHSIQLSGYLEQQDYRTALQKICVACQSVAYSNREGKITVKKLYTESPVATVDYTKKAISTSEKLEQFGAVTVNYSTALGFNDDVRTVFSGSVNGDKMIIFNEPMDKVTITGADSYTIYANCVDVQTNSNKTVTVKASPLTIFTKNPVKVTNYTSENVTNLETTIEGINVITNSTLASSVATWLLNELQRSTKESFRCICNPAIEIGDTISLQIGDTEYVNALVVKNKIKFNGALSEEMEVVIEEV